MTIKKVHIGVNETTTKYKVEQLPLFSQLCTRGFEIKIIQSDNSQQI